ncbi:MAG: PEPxxWA-CTERM sorting domain-containing protein [Sulfuricellaceae bacterium]|nr:PEPxxWA-CTERM sorting domain-containing protein [Sulfuricellaceae bacterium]
MLKPLTVAMIIALSSLATPTYAVQYKVTDLGVGRISGFGYDPKSINNAGEVLADRAIQISPGSGTYYTRPAVWNGSAWLQMPEISGRSGSDWTYWAGGLNSAGVVVGNSGLTAAEDDDSISGNYQSFIWDTRANTVSFLNTPSYGSEHGASDINDNGVITGTMGNSGANYSGHAMTWKNSVYTDLSTRLQPGNSDGQVINNNGAVAGYDELNSGLNVAFYADAAKVDYLGPRQGGDDIWVNDMNDSGLVALTGNTAAGEQPQVGVVWDTNSGMVYELAVDPQWGSRANGVNNLGQVVGRSGGGAIWDAVNGLHMLYTDILSTTWGFYEGADINDSGVIVGYGGLMNDHLPDSQKEFRMLMLTPVPEPETYALMLAGLGLVGFAARRRA